MIAAHMDEVGLIISHIDPSGFARVGLLGRKDPAGLIGHTAEFPGGRMAVLRVETDSKDEAISVDKLFLDFGSSGPGQVEINVGDVGCLANGQHRLGDRFVRSNAGGRSAVVTLIRVLQSLERPTAELQFVFSVQGEFGSDGGRTSAASLEPQAALVIAPAPSGDTPGKASQTIRLGGGPVIVIRHGSVASDARMVEAIVSQADKSRIACQMAALEFELPGSTMPAANDGLITAWVCIPCRGLGGTAEMVDMGDIDATVRLLTALSQSRLEWL
jgi:endoglucanase